jgi:HEXXH motif-containing protein
LDYLGVIFTTFVERAQQSEELRRSVLAVDLAHELGHQALMLYQLTDKILATPHDAPVYSSVRRTDRPAIFALHACVAAAYMIETCIAIERSPVSSQAEQEFARNSISEIATHQRVGLDSLRKESKFTQIGQLIFDELESQLTLVETQSFASKNQPSPLSYFGLLAP